MDNKEFNKQLVARTRGFAIQIIKLSDSLEDRPEFRVIKYLISKSGTSIGANYREGNRSRVGLIFQIKLNFAKARLVNYKQS